jgi:hypothetical protein
MKSRKRKPVMDESKLKECRIEREAARDFREEIPGVVEKLVQSCDREECFDHVDLAPLPSKDAIIAVTHTVPGPLSPLPYPIDKSPYLLLRPGVNGFLKRCRADHPLTAEYPPPYVLCNASAGEMAIALCELRS